MIKIVQKKRGDMGKLYIHLGTPKTGTTAIQEFMYRNHNVMEERGISYPLFHYGKYTNRNGLFLSDYCHAIARKKDPIEQIPNANEMLEEIRASVEKYPTTIVSNEGFWHTGQAFWKAFKRVMEQLGIDDYEFIVYLRRQDQFIASAWKQWIVVKNTEMPFAQFVREAGMRYTWDYAQCFKTIMSAFDTPPTFIVKVYDKKQFVDQDLIHDFLDIFGVKWDDTFKEIKLINQSLSFDMTEALRLSSIKHNTTRAQNLFSLPLLMYVTKKYPDEKNLNAFSKEEYEALMREYQEGNAWVSKQFLDGKALFSDVYVGNLWKPNEKRIQKVVKMLDYLIPVLSFSDRIHLLSFVRKLFFNIRIK